MLAEIDDFQSTMCDRDMFHLEHAAGIRATRLQHGIHVLQLFDVRLRSIEADFSADSTHGGLRGRWQIQTQCVFKCLTMLTYRENYFSGICYLFSGE